MTSLPSCRFKYAPARMVAICLLLIRSWLLKMIRRPAMTERKPPSEDRVSHLRAYAAVQKQTTIARLKQAIEALEAEGRPVNTFTIKEISGMDYMTYYRNREAFQLFQEHSTHLRKEREKAQAKRQVTSRGSSRKPRKGQAASHAV